MREACPCAVFVSGQSAINAAVELGLPDLLAAGEFRALFECAGFRIDRIVPAVLEFRLIEASPDAC